jgi:hypothetical protein
MLFIPFLISATQCPVKTKVNPPKKPAKTAVCPAPKAALKPTPLPTPCCGQSDIINQSASNAKNINIIKIMPPALPNIKKNSTHTAVVAKKIYRNPRPNRFLLMLGESQSRYEIIQQGCCVFDIRKKPENDVGLLYMRDFGSFSGSIMGTHRGNGYIGLGFNF